MFDFIKRRNNKDFASVAEINEIKGIAIPVITLEKYPEIAKRTLSLVEKVSKQISEESGQTVDEVLESLTVTDMVRYIPKIITIAADELFSFVAFVLDVDEQIVRKLGVADLTRICMKVYEVNEFAEVQAEIRNFMKTLAKKKSQSQD